MTRRAATRARQRGAALLVIAALLTLGIAWGAFAALNRGSSLSPQEREVLTGQALRAAKQALLAYAAHYAARTDHDKPGRMPCPEALNSIGTTAEGDEAAGGCSNTAANLGRLPWRTLGIDRLADGSGEPLWYALSPGFRGVTPTTVINFDTPGQLTYNGAANAAVAVIIAPGRPLDTLADAAALPAWCPAKVNQYAAGRTTAPLDPANFLECGNATGSYRNPGSSQWSNDRAITITAAEWATAIAGAVNDRIQRQVVPAMMDFRSTTSVASWGASFLPNASTISASLSGSQPESNNMCGNLDMRSGMPPTATVASGLCATNWTGGNASGLGSILLGTLLSFDGCTALATHMRCEFTVILGGLLPPRITLTAPRIGYSFRRVDPSQITYQRNFGAQQPATTGSYIASVSAADGSGSFSFQITLPLLSIADNIRVWIPHPTDALLADTRSAWYIENGWDRHTYYGVSQAATHDPGGSVCNPGGTITGCLTVNGMPAPANDKRLVLVLMARPLPGTTQPSYAVADYLEGQNASVGVIYETASVDADFNDRVAACPFKYQNHLGADVVICN